MQWAHNINYALKWVQPKAEKELKEAFELSMKVKDLSPESKQISEKYSNFITKDGVLNHTQELKLQVQQ